MTTNIAIDGTAGSGKGTVSKLLAKKLGFFHLDTGAIYRSVALFMIVNDVDVKNEKMVCIRLNEIVLKVELSKGENGESVQKNILFDVDLGDRIRTEEISVASSIVSQYRKVRKFAVSIQHKLAKKYDLVVEGRDIGTVVLPKAQFKFFLTAKPEIRAERRLGQLGLPKTEFKKVLKEIEERDLRDTTREISPLLIAKDAIYVDNSNKTIEETVEFMAEAIKS